MSASASYVSRSTPSGSAHCNFFYTSRGVKNRLLVRYPILLAPAHCNFFYTGRGVKGRLLFRYSILFPADQLTVIFFTQVGGSNVGC